MLVLGPLERDLPAQLVHRRVGLGAGDPVRVALGVDEPESALNLPAAVSPLRDPGVSVRAGASDERTAAVTGAALAAGHRRPLPIRFVHRESQLYRPLYHRCTSSA